MSQYLKCLLLKLPKLLKPNRGGNETVRPGSGFGFGTNL